MIRLAHARNLHAAEYWVRRRRRQLDANPVPLLAVAVSAHHAPLRAIVERAGIDDAFYVDASTQGHVTALREENVLFLSDRDSLHEARAFMHKAHRATRCLDVLLVEDTLQPDLTWCQEFVDSYEALA